MKKKLLFLFWTFLLMGGIFIFSSLVFEFSRASPGPGCDCLRNWCPADVLSEEEVPPLVPGVISIPPQEAVQGAVGFCPLLEGGLVPCGRQTDDPTTPNICECYPCELCHLFVLTKKIVDFALFKIVAPLAILMIVIGGVMFLTAGGSPEQISSARKLMTNVAIGILIIFTAWIIVNTIITFLTPATSPLQAWYEIACPYCGNGTCDPREDPFNCPVDCLAFLWVPLSGIDKLAQIDFTNGNIIATYDVGDNPSRVTVVPGGDVWVANRDSANVTRLTPDWDNLPYYKKADGSPYPVGKGPRAITYDLNGNIWVGNAVDDTIMELDPLTGKVIKGPYKTGKSGCGPYGAIGDPYGNVWFVDRNENQVIKVDLNARQIYTNISLPGACCPYGIGMDNQGDIWVAAWESSDCLMYQIFQKEMDPNTGFNKITCYPTTKNLSDYPQQNLFGTAARGRGIAVDGNNNVWVVRNSAGAWETANSYVYKFDNEGKYITHTQVGQGAVGVAIDKENNIWVVNFGGGGPNCIGNCTGGSVTKLNNAGGVIATYGFGGIDPATHPYNYSDMTGFRSIGCPKPR